MSNKKQVSRHKRWRVLARDNFRCVYCGTTAEAKELHIDHLYPQALGGTDDEDNLVTACVDCNIGKRSQLLQSLVERPVEQYAAEAIHAVGRAVTIFTNHVERHLIKALNATRNPWKDPSSNLLHRAFHQESLAYEPWEMEDAGEP
jgi:CRISPR/Cas system Type II protein with McrA/HNH and RuvC-like nuclease domain